jgi:hypothetical protein
MEWTPARRERLMRFLVREDTTARVYLIDHDHMMSFSPNIAREIVKSLEFTRGAETYWSDPPERARVYFEIEEVAFRARIVIV